MFARGGAFPCDLSFLAVFAGFFLALILCHWKLVTASRRLVLLMLPTDRFSLQRVPTGRKYQCSCLRERSISQSNTYLFGIDDDHYYNVTAVFTDAQGNVTESSFSNTASLSLSIEAIENAMNASSYDVYTLDGQAVMLNAKSLKGLKKGAYIINDRKFILK